MKEEEETNILSGAKLFYPSAKFWMWSYCMYLGSFTDSRGDNFDLGILLDNSVGGQSVAIVFDDEPGKYISGDFKNFNSDKKSELYNEVEKRAKALGVWDEEGNKK